MSNSKKLKEKNYINTHRNRFIDELIKFLCLPSVGADPLHKNDTLQAAHFVKEALAKAGADEVKLLKTPGFPIVFAQKIINPSLPTVMLYGHYDVQPADPIELWKTAPFEPTIRNNNIYARGASDDKGQVYLHIKALETMIQCGTLPCNIKFLIEGEEEVGSPHILTLIEDPQYKDLLSCHAAAVSDMNMPEITQPVIPMSLRGMVMMEVTLKGPSHDLHSGAYGGAVANPIHGLVQLLSSLKNDQQQITIPGFYDDVVNFTPEERSQLHEIPFDEEAYKKSIGVEALNGESGYTPVERATLRPTLEINGISAGAQQAKTVLPSVAKAIISMRLVHKQDPKKILQLTQSHLHELARKLPAMRGIKLKSQVLSGVSDAFFNEKDGKATQAVKTAFKEVWGGDEPKFVCCGGSIPLLSGFQKYITKEVAMLGFGLDNDAIHSPNEKFGIENYLKGIATSCRFYQVFTDLWQKK